MEIKMMTGCNDGFGADQALGVMLAVMKGEESERVIFSSFPNLPLDSPSPCRRLPVELR